MNNFVTPRPARRPAALPWWLLALVLFVLLALGALLSPAPAVGSTSGSSNVALGFSSTGNNKTGPANAPPGARAGRRAARCWATPPP